MTSISYERIFNYFMGNVTAYEFAQFDESEANELMTEYLHKTVADPYVRELFKSVTLDDTNSSISFELAFDVDEDVDTDFIILILSNGMTVQWLKPQVRSKINIAQLIAGKEQKFYAQSNHISELRGLLEDTENELRKQITDRGYINNMYLRQD